jgi:Cu+-exporting ATPase
MQEEAVRIPSELQSQAIKMKKLAFTPVFVGVDNEVAAIVGIADSIRSTSAAVIAQLHNQNITTVMLTGDNATTADAIAAQLHIDRVFSEVLPQDKEAKIRELKQGGSVVAMVGDGINDAPALATADVGIAMGNGTDVAIESADIALLRSDISLVPTAIALSKATMRNIRQNLIWAFAYNIVLIPVAMGALYPFFGIQLHPILASAAMALSSVSVVANALRLQKEKLT